MHPLSSQIQNATGTIKLHLGRLKGDVYPVWADDAKSLGKPYGRIEKAREYLRDVDREKVKGEVGGRGRRLRCKLSLFHFSSNSS